MISRYFLFCKVLRGYITHLFGSSVIIKIRYDAESTTLVFSCPDIEIRSNVLKSLEQIVVFVDSLGSFYDCKLVSNKKRFISP